MSEILEGVSNDFLGYLTGKKLEIKKIKILEIYRYFFRFSFERIKKFADSPTLIITLLQYLKNSKMKRMHEKAILKTSTRSYYRAVENLINLSCHKLMIC